MSPHQAAQDCLTAIDSHRSHEHISYPQLEACEGFFARTGEFLLETFKSFLRFLIIVGQGKKKHCDASHTHTHTRNTARETESEGARTGEGAP